LPRSWLIFPLLFLYLLNLGTTGFLGPDEPRYASIGREMARSHDFVTPRLAGPNGNEPWFEKPPLLYWSTAIGRIILRLPDEWAARLPVALMSLAFLWFFFGVLEREFSQRTAVAATSILATSVGWMAYSFAAVTDLPMTAALGAAMLIALFDTRLDTFHRQRTNPGYWAGALLGLAMLAKGFVPVVLFAPLFLVARRKRLTMIAGCIVVAAPWYVWCWARNGSAFWHEFFWKHHVQRFLTPLLEHVQPWWFFLPVILLGLFPWTPLAALLLRGKTYDDVRVRSLALWLVYALLFFSVARNKLPGYVLPLMPPLAIVLAVGLEKTGSAMKWWIAACTLPMLLLPGIATSLPNALLFGVKHASVSLRPSLPFLIGVPVVVVVAWWLAWKNNSAFAIAVAAMGMIVGVVYLKGRTFRELDARVSARSFERDNLGAIQRGETCIGDEVRRDWQYQLNYYSDMGRALPMCPADGDPQPHLRVSNRDGALVIIKK
jgi:4-amino-4-deoxy-L-arabinose transferase-like glycosyltransferase